MGERLIVQFARGSRRNENFTPHERAAPRPRRTPFRMRIANLPVETSWQVRYPSIWIFCVSGLDHTPTPRKALFTRTLFPVPRSSFPFPFPFPFLCPFTVTGFGLRLYLASTGS